MGCWFSVTSLISGGHAGLSSYQRCARSFRTTRAGGKTGQMITIEEILSYNGCDAFILFNLWPETRSPAANQNPEKHIRLLSLSPSDWLLNAKSWWWSAGISWGTGGARTIGTTRTFWTSCMCPTIKSVLSLWRWLANKVLFLPAGKSRPARAVGWEGGWAGQVLNGVLWRHSVVMLFWFQGQEGVSPVTPGAPGQKVSGLNYQTK